MSRLIVKNLPKNINDQTLKDLFGQRGTVTDIQLKYTKDGKFRNFAFIGYQNENEAEEAIKYLDNTFIKTSRIRVENCATLGDEKKPKSWSKYAADSTAFKKVNKIDQKSDPVIPKEERKSKKKIDESAQLLEKYKDDPMFEEFLQVHAPSEIQKLNKIEQIQIENEEKTNDNSDGNSNEDSPDEDDDNGNNTETDKLADKQISDIEYMKQLMKGNSERKPRQKMEKKVKEKIKLFTVKLRDLPYNIKKKDIKDFFKPAKCYSIRIPRNIHGIAYAGFKTEKLCNNALIKNRSFIKGKRVLVLKYTADGNTEVDKEETGETNIFKNKWKNQEESLKNEEDIAESGKIFIRNLSYSTTEENIEQLFSKFGPLTEVNLPIDPNSKIIKGFGTVTFLMPEHAVKAYTELDGSILQGRMVHLLPGKSKDTTEEDLLEESSNYKKKKSAKEKAQAGSGHNWNSLFLGHDAVAEVIADTYGTTKEAVIGPKGKGSAAVRLALGETQIVAQTRKYLEDEGVVLDAFMTPSTKRSKTVILVKNLPSRTEARVIRELFEKHGYVGRVILPPSGITAIVEFLEPSEARKAFTRLAYSKFQNVPLYLEWAPENSLKETSGIKPKEKGETNNEDKNSQQSEKIETVIEEEEDEDEPEPETTLFVKNLNFKTTDEGLRKHFEGCGKIHYANVALKKDINDPTNRLSMGYGFVRFMLKTSTDKALKTLQQSVLDGKSLELKRSERTLKNEVQTTKKSSKKTKQTGTKILVRNIPFQATKKEIEELFSTFGEIKALRLPKKMAAGSNSHRGFAFVDYSTESDAKTAFDALSQSTHLFGRRLVLEWASTGEDLDEVRKRTADHFGSGPEVKKSKKSVLTLD